MTVTHPKIRTLSKEWKVAQFGDAEGAFGFGVKRFCDLANESIHARGRFCVALSGGKTPAPLYQRLTLPTYKSQVDWSKVFLFWSDERSVPPDHQESNYRMAMESGMARLGIPSEQIFRMQAEADLEVHAAAYEHLVKKHAGEGFDLVLLGMGEDGHTASLFPETAALGEEQALVVPNYIPKFQSWRMTLTFPCINQARNIHIYVLGQRKEALLSQVLLGAKGQFPIQRIGTSHHPALWITDCLLDLP